MPCFFFSVMMAGMNVIHHPHDKYFRASMSNLRVAEEFFEAHLPKSVLPVVDLKSLSLQSNSFISEELNQHMSDILYAVNIKSRPGYLYILAEHQSSDDKWMPVRVLNYMLRIMEDDIKKLGRKTLPVVVPLVFYHGRKKPYPYSTDLFDLFSEEDRPLAEKFLLKPFHLIDTSRLSDNEMMERSHSGVMEFIHKHIFERDLLRYVEFVAPFIKQLQNSGENNYIIETVHYLFSIAGLKEHKQLIRILKDKVFDDSGEETMITIAEYYRMQGEARGEAKGEVRGKQKAAVALMKAGVDPHLIARVMGFTHKEVEVLQTEADELFVE